MAKLPSSHILTTIQALQKGQGGYVNPKTLFTGLGGHVYLNGTYAVRPEGEMRTRMFVRRDDEGRVCVRLASSLVHKYHPAGKQATGQDICVDELTTLGPRSGRRRTPNTPARKEEPKEKVK